MKTLFQIACQLRKGLNEANNQNYLNDDLWVTPQEIHILRKYIDNIPDDKIPKEKLQFLNNCFDFNSIYSYFYLSTMAEHSQCYNANEEISERIDPLCIYLLDNDYEITIRKISLSNATNDLHHNILSKIEELEIACQEENYDRVTTLSSSILQSVFKAICDKEEITYNNKDKFPSLFKKVKQTLNIDPSNHNDKKDIREFCSKLSNLIITINELRNLYSDSHGVQTKSLLTYKNIPKHHYKLIVDCTKTSVNFIMSSYIFQYDKDKVTI